MQVATKGKPDMKMITRFTAMKGRKEYGLDGNLVLHWSLVFPLAYKSLIGAFNIYLFQANRHTYV